MYTKKVQNGKFTFSFGSLKGEEQYDVGIAQECVALPSGMNTYAPSERLNLNTAAFMKEHKLKSASLQDNQT